tara:strand:- start:1340 stop:2281 length:942 start_codon:yes stop_codon:yes gene_type:complete
MITKIFKRLTIRAIITGFFLTYSANFFVLFCRASGNLYNQIFIESFIFSLNILLIIILTAFSETRRFNLKFGATHLISFPLCIMLFAQGQFVNPQKLIILFSLLFSANILSKEINKINPVKDFFVLGFIFTSMSYINPNFSLFFFSIFLVIIYIPFKQKALISILLGIVAALSILITISHVITGNFSYPQLEILESNIFTPFEKENSEFVWISTVIIALIASLLMKQKKLQRRSLFDLGNSGNFMSIWLLISIIFRVFDLYVDESKWLLSYIPTAFFIGNIFETLSKERYREILFYSLLFLGVISNLYNVSLI